MENPFEILLARLDQIEKQITEIKIIADKLQQVEKQSEPEFMHLKEVVPKYMSAPTFYNFVHQKRIALYKVGRKSFVKRSEFFQAFRKVEIA